MASNANRTAGAAPRPVYGLWIAVLTIIPAASAQGGSPLADAAQRNDFASVRAMLARQDDVRAAQADGTTALHWAAYHEKPDFVRDLLDAGADVTAANDFGVTPLSLACTNGNGPIVRMLLDAGADPHSTLPGDETALMTAARTGRLAPVRALLESGAEVNAIQRDGQTALMWAAADGHVDVVDALLKAGADVRRELPSGFTAFFFAVREGRAEVVARLLRAGIDVHDTMRVRRRGASGRSDGINALLLAVENGHFELATQLIAAGADPNAAPTGYAPLHAMTWVRKPIRGDGDPPPRGSGAMGSLDFVRELVDRGADVNARLQKGSSGQGRFTTTGSTAFLLAVRAGDVPLAHLLLQLGADPELPNVTNTTALLAASGVGALGNGEESAGTEAEAIETIRLLLDLGADINAVDDNGETAMHGAAYQNWPTVIRLLADKGADIDIWNRKNKWGWTPLMIAQGYRPGNFRPAPESIVAIEAVMREASRGVQVPQ